MRKKVTIVGSGNVGATAYGRFEADDFADRFVQIGVTEKDNLAARQTDTATDCESFSTVGEAENTNSTVVSTKIAGYIGSGVRGAVIGDNNLTPDPTRSRELGDRSERGWKSTRFIVGGNQKAAATSGHESS
jgi:hypothetical protein